MPLITSATRSVPDEWFELVITTSNVYSFNTFSVFEESMATRTLSSRSAIEARSITCTIKGFPAMGANIFSGKRVDFNLAGMTPITTIY